MASRRRPRPCITTAPNLPFARHSASFICFQIRWLENEHIPTLTNMANTTPNYYSLPTQAPQSRSGSRRPPLTPSTVSSPCLSTAPIATRRDSGAGSPTKASALLAKVASHPSTPRGETPSSSPMATPDSRTAEMQSSPLYSTQRPAVWRSESARYVHQQRQQGKHVLRARSGE